MKRLVLSLALLFSGCGGGPLPEESFDEQVSRASAAITVSPSRTIPARPAVPERPVDLSSSTYVWGPLIRGSPSSVFTVVTRSPDESARFVAYGFDVRSSRTLFYVTGLQTDSRRFRHQLADDLTEVFASSGPDVFAGSAGEIVGPPSPHPGPQVHDWAWQKAYKHYEIEASMAER